MGLEGNAGGVEEYKTRTSTYSKASEGPTVVGMNNMLQAFYIDDQNKA